MAGKVSNFFKEMRVEYKVVLFFVVMLILYTIYSLFAPADWASRRTQKSQKPSYSAPARETSSSSNSSNNSNGADNSASSIEKALSNDRPIIIDPKAIKQKLSNLQSENRQIKSMEMATEVENPTIWIYIANDGERKDELAGEYCKWLYENGILASSVTLLDEAARAKGRLVELGESKCGEK